MYTLSLRHLDALYNFNAVECPGCGAAEKQIFFDLLNFGLVESTSQIDAGSKTHFQITQTGQKVLRAASEFVLGRL